MIFYRLFDVYREFGLFEQVIPYLLPAFGSRKAFFSSVFTGFRKLLEGQLTTHHLTENQPQFLYLAAGRKILTPCGEGQEWTGWGQRQRQIQPAQLEAQARF